MINIMITITFSILRNSRGHATAITIIITLEYFSERFVFQLMHDTNLDSQSEFKATDVCALKINRRYHLLLWMLISLTL